MPKEVIRVGPNDDPRFSIHVGWHRDCEVQIATVNEAHRAEHGLQDGGGGWFLTLTRPEINRVIRALRQARDVAYGKDE